MREPIVNLAARRNFLNNAELIRRLHAVGEHQKAAMIYRGHHGPADRMQLRGAEQQGGVHAGQREEARENEAALAGASTTTLTSQATRWQNSSHGGPA